MVPGQFGENYHETPSEKQTKSRRIENIAHIVEHLLSKCQTLSSNHRTLKKRLHTVHIA
jgi:hypothetical protein